MVSMEHSKVEREREHHHKQQQCSTRVSKVKTIPTLTYIHIHTMNAFWSTYSANNFKVSVRNVVFPSHPLSVVTCNTNSSY